MRQIFTWHKALRNKSYEENYSVEMMKSHGMCHSVPTLLVTNEIKSQITTQMKKRFTVREVRKWLTSSAIQP